MHLKPPIAILCFCLALGLGTNTTGATAPIPAGNKHRLIRVDGKVELNNPGFLRPIRIGPYTHLNQQDLIRLEPGTTATIQCQGGWTVRWRVSGTSGMGQICPPGPDIQGRQQRVMPRPGEGFYVISPWGTALLTDRPPLRWQAMGNASSYEVTLYADGNAVYDDWTITVPASACEDKICAIDYPAEFPPLVSGPNYWLVLRSDRGEMSRSHPNLQFYRLSREKRAVAAAIQRQIEAEGFSDSEVALALADLYQAMGLIGPAVDQLEAVPDSSSSAEAMIFLGDLYSQMGLGIEAEQAYAQAVNQALPNTLILARSQVALGSHLIRIEGRQQEAIGWLTDAIALYQSLGDPDTAATLRGLLENI